VSARPQLSIVVPLFNERENVAPLVEATRAVLGRTRDWELILVDDGSDDGTADEIRRMSEDDARVRMLRLDYPATWSRRPCTSSAVSYLPPWLRYAE